MQPMKKILMTLALAISCLTFAEGAMAAKSCTLSPVGNGESCATGLYVKTSDGVVLSECQDRYSAKGTYESLMKAGMCEAFQCSIKTPAECSDHGGYAVTNQDGERISECSTGRAIIDDLHSLTDAGVCTFQGW